MPSQGGSGTSLSMLSGKKMAEKRTTTTCQQSTGRPVSRGFERYNNPRGSVPIAIETDRNVFSNKRKKNVYWLWNSIVCAVCETTKKKNHYSRTYPENKM
mmetsp:Transcript_12707/g.26353  ORF Transcript_12707/g.26353 Transcript_12707/m.26353 type:complete len:100 (+) Transcript_12707:438-737(+)